MSNKKKKPGIKVPAPVVEKKPRTARPPERPDECFPAWRFAAMDFDGMWGWSKCSGESLMTLHGRLRSFESMTWGEIKRNDSSGTHLIEVYRISPDARSRLQDIFKDDIDELMSLRIGGAGRMWGIMDHHVFRVLWWDPDHTVYPVAKRNT